MIEKINYDDMYDIARKLNEVIDVVNGLTEVDVEATKNIQAAARRIVERTEPKTQGIWKSQQQVAVDQAIAAERERIARKVYEFSIGSSISINQVLEIVRGENE